MVDMRNTLLATLLIGLAGVLAITMVSAHEKENSLPSTAQLSGTGSIGIVSSTVSDVDDFLGYDIRTHTSEVDPPTYVLLKDQFMQEPSRFKVKRPKMLYNPADKAFLPDQARFEDVRDKVTHLKSYKVRGPRMEQHDVRVNTEQFGEFDLRVKNPTYLLLPSTKGHSPELAPDLSQLGDLNHFLCYKARRIRVREEVSLADQFGKDNYRIRNITKLCNPVEKQVLDAAGNVIEQSPIVDPELHLLCLKVRGPRQKQSVNTNDQFHRETLRVRGPQELCVPATKIIAVPESPTAELEITAHADNPKERVVIVSNTENTLDVVLALVNVKAKNNDVIIRSINIDTMASSVASSTLFAVTVYDGATALSSTSSIGSATATLANVDLLIPRDTIKTLTFKAEVKKSQGNYEEGAESGFKVEANADGFDVEDATSLATATVSGSAVIPGVRHNYVKAPLIALVSTEIVGVAGTAGSSTPVSLDGKVRLNITAQGGDIYIPVYSTTAASNGLLGEARPDLGSTTLTQSFISNADFGSVANDTYVIPNGSTKYLELSGNIAACPISGTPHFTGLSVQNIKWGTSVATAGGVPANIWTWGLEHLKTAELFLPACT